MSLPVFKECPICTIFVDLSNINAHLDSCLEKSMNIEISLGWECDNCGQQNAQELLECDSCVSNRPGLDQSALIRQRSKDYVDEHCYCSSCNNIGSIDQMTILSACNHTFCPKCLRGAILSSIDNPSCASCETPIQLVEIQKALTVEEIKPFLEDSLKKTIKDINFSKVVCEHCSKSTTIKTPVISIDASQFSDGPEHVMDQISALLYCNCPNCNTKMCMSCGSAPHTQEHSFCSAAQFKAVDYTLRALNESWILHRGDKDEHSECKKSLDGGKGYGGDLIDGHISQLIASKLSLQSFRDSIVANVLEHLRYLLSDPLLIFQVPTPLFALLKNSKLTQVLAYFLRNDSLMDIASRPSLYFSIFHFCRSIGVCSALLSLFCDNNTQHPSLLSLLQQIHSQANIVLAFPSNIITQNVDAETLSTLGISADIKDIVDILLSNCHRWTQIRIDFSHSLEVAIAKGKVVKIQNEGQNEDYITHLKDILSAMQFATMDILGGAMGYSFAKEAKNSMNTPAKGRLMRLRKEMASLSNNMPAGIFLRVDSSRFDIMRILIVGPHDTPYENGCYLFDIFLPSDYPRSPPQVKFLTTGNGKFRQNANLYSSGKVCLSLLGTWSGPGWDEMNSTLLQLFISIQAFILCEDPYGNEPGWQFDARIDRANLYHNALRHATLLYAIDWHIENPPIGFEDVTKIHFWLSREQILQRCQEWPKKIKETSSDASTIYGDAVVKDRSLDQTVSKLQDHLKSLTLPEFKEVE